MSSSPPNPAPRTTTRSFMFYFFVAVAPKGEEFELYSIKLTVYAIQGEKIDDIGVITALDEELNQSDRYLVAEEERDVIDN